MQVKADICQYCAGLFYKPCTFLYISSQNLIFHCPYLWKVFQSWLIICNFVFHFLTSEKHSEARLQNNVHFCFRNKKWQWTSCVYMQKGRLKVEDVLCPSTPWLMTRLQRGVGGWIVILMVKAAFSVSVVNKSVGGSTLSLRAFVFLQWFYFPSLITDVGSTNDCMLFVYCKFCSLDFTGCRWYVGTFLKCNCKVLFTEKRQ